MSNSEFNPHESGKGLEAIKEEQQHISDIGRAKCSSGVSSGNNTATSAVIKSAGPWVRAGPNTEQQFGKRYE